MCGLAGFIGDFDDQLLEKMGQSISHRGPDGSGIWSNKEARVGMTHRRLSIIDLSMSGIQPMHDHTRRYVVVFNGEIYNFKDLALDLRSKGYVFNPNSDTAILAPLYDLYGVEMLNRLSGIFAFAIWDSKEEVLFAARDHLGIKPFYYAELKQGILFSSEIKSLLQCDKLERQIDEDALFSYISYLWSPGQKTLFKSINKLLPGHFLLFQAQKLTTQRWYSPPQAPIISAVPRYDHQKSPQDLLHLIDEVVRGQMVADVKIGAFLSGGLDSSAVVASMAETMSNRSELQAFCVSFLGKDSESEGFGEDIIHARHVAQTLGVKLTEVEVSSASLESLAEVIYYLDEPQADPAPIFVQAVCAAARSAGIKVMMSGTGGDDVFSGYRRHLAMDFKSKINRTVPRVFREAIGATLRLFPGNSTFGRRLDRLGRLLSVSDNDALIAAYYYTEPKILLQVLSPDLREAYKTRRADHLESTLDESKGQHLLNRQLYSELQGFLPDHNLNYTDKLSMAAGVEVRVPLLDPKLLLFAADLPPQMKLMGRNGKLILKKAMEQRLPREVIYRKKAGFGAPVRSWMVGEKEQFMRDVVLSNRALQRGIFDAQGIERLIADTKSGRVDGAYTLLSLVAIELWFQQFLDPKVPTKLVV
jgi:asparagine synthase (glutamine-hydrolysing)